jgi:polyisoprenoid-binding protein YceI
VEGSGKSTLRSIARDRLRLEITGTLSLHGTARNIVLPVTFWTVGDTCHAQAETWLRQTDYGIKPYSAGLGTIRVKDDVRISFHLVGNEMRRGEADDGR